MELLQIQPPKFSEICPCVNQTLPCYCEERAGYSSVSYDFPLTIDTNIEYELTGLQIQRGADDEYNPSSRQTLLIDHTTLANRQQLAADQWTQSHDISHMENPTSPDLYTMIDNLNVDVAASGTPEREFWLNESYCDTSAFVTSPSEYVAALNGKENYNPSSPFGVPACAPYMPVYPQHVNTVPVNQPIPWQYNALTSACIYPHDSSASSASGYPLHCRAY